MSVIEKLKQLQADSQVFYFKLHNLHWNVKGMMFEPIHLKTEALYNEFAVIFDDIAERQLQLRSEPIVTMQEALKVSQIKEIEKSSFNASEVVQTLITDLDHFYTAFKQLSEASDNDSTTAAYADDKIAWLEKELWMLRSMME
ncbi:MAG: DNA starvation/stationary phase protection protein [Bacteriovoracaceae bacterium]|jgi:starvation-inducible DNA-binding protein|nr:DNA starvation/stationary phase protection protein [Halobacteriovoraceae bacterium]MDP7320190.1 DNA starvation/stationary phase protection protein [Bacteriovoracaceae bacterium]|tara:strand:- start:333 stop:761 length:429 start_codon:yes stop_codon:yes gene_type:complete